MDQWIGGDEASLNALRLWSYCFACIVVLILYDARLWPRILPDSLPTLFVTMEVQSQSLFGCRKDWLQTPHRALLTLLADPLLHLLEVAPEKNGVCLQSRKEDSSVGTGVEDHIPQSHIDNSKKAFCI
jgi:hypothetical protein